MTPTEVLKELNKMPLEARRIVHDKLHEELLEGSDPNNGRKNAIISLMKKNRLTELPRKAPVSDKRRDFKPITVTGEPVSETIIKERR